MERTDHTQGNRKGRMPWKPVAALIGLVIYLVLFIGSGTYLLTDDSCRNDKQGLEKRCQTALKHYRG